MPNFKFSIFNKGWVHKQLQLISLDGFSDVSNFTMLKGAIEKVKGWKKLELIPISNTDKTPTYPLQGLVQSIFEYIKFEEEEIRLSPFEFNYLEAFGLPPRLRYTTDFSNSPEDGPNENTYGLIFTCELSCGLTQALYTILSDTEIAGPSVRVGHLSTRDSATLLALIYNPFDGSLAFVRYINQPLTIYGTILWSDLGLSIVTGDIIEIRQIATNTWRILLNSVILATITDTVLPDTNNCNGVVQLRSFDNM